jgi:hypothetical protein
MNLFHFFEFVDVQRFDLNSVDSEIILFLKENSNLIPEEKFLSIQEKINLNRK